MKLQRNSTQYILLTSPAVTDSGRTFLGVRDVGLYNTSKAAFALKGFLPGAAHKNQRRPWRLHPKTHLHSTPGPDPCCDGSFRLYAGGGLCLPSSGFPVSEPTAMVANTLGLHCLRRKNVATRGSD